MPKRKVHESIRVDRELTAQRRGDGTYLDSRSQVHQDGREYLKGVDVGRRRQEVWERDKRHCVVCGVYVTWDAMEMDHIGKNYGQKRHDNIENLRTLCSKCHRAKHVHTQFTQQEA
jgi:5-methylcytosine-specific restriction endonuclease McrA